MVARFPTPRGFGFEVLPGVATGARGGLDPAATPEATCVSLEKVDHTQTKGVLLLLQSEHPGFLTGIQV